MSASTPSALLRSQQFLPLFIAQAIGAFNDNALRNAINILIVFQLYEANPQSAQSFVQIGTGLFMLPFLLFSAIAGQLADKFDKALIARRVKLFELLTMIFGAYALWQGNPVLDLLALFLAGTVAAFFGPVKYGILPQYLPERDLINGNALIEMGTFVAILLGTLAGGALIATSYGPALVAIMLISLAVIAWYATGYMPPAPSLSPHHQLDWNIFRQSKELFHIATQRKDVFWSVLGASWFWVLGTVILSQLPIFTKIDVGGDQYVTQIFIITFTLGIATGSLTTNRLLKGEVSARYVPMAAVMISLCLIDLYFTAGSLSQRASPSLLGIGAFFNNFTSWHLLLDLFLVAFFGGIYAVPLNAIMQDHAAPETRARVIAANNISNALFMISGSVVAAFLLQFMSSYRLFLILAVINLGVAVWSIRLLPQTTLAYLARLVLRLLYRVEVKGLEHYHAAGARTVIVANHSSLLDGPLLSAFIPDRCSFAVNSFMAKKWWVKPAFSLFDLVALDPTNPLAIRGLVERVKEGSRVVIFPEGRITVTGGLMKIYEGPAVIADMAGANILPLRIEGTLFSKYARMKGKLHQRWFPKITLHFMPHVKLEAPNDLKGTALRNWQANSLYNVMSELLFQTSPYQQTLFNTLLAARHRHGGHMLILEDINREPRNYNQVVMGSFILGRRIHHLARDQKNIGLLLPNAVGAMVTLMGLQAYGRVAALLNFSTGITNMLAACKLAEVSSIVTSRKFIEGAEMGADLAALATICQIIYLEDIRADLGLNDKLYGFYASWFSPMAARQAGAAQNPTEPAVILFTSGSEGTPKAVVLSHQNLNANRLQVATRIAFNETDIVFNALPIFHAFGLLGGALLPLLSGVRSFLYPSPLHLKIIPELVYDSNATAFFGTDTFLMGYARNASAYDFYNLRLVVAGAERIKPETRQVYAEKFGLQIMEGYGATECSPVISVNTPLYHQPGTTGRVLDGIETRLEPVPGIDVGGRLFVKGPNIMRGYLSKELAGQIQAPPDGWYDTGDIVTIDDNKFVTILGRAKRFAKIGGEMVSLGYLENLLQAHFPNDQFAILAIPDSKKGEQLILYTTQSTPTRKTIADALKAQGVTELMIPKTLHHLDQIPLLGTGKVDYVTLQKQAIEQNT